VHDGSPPNAAADARLPIRETPEGVALRLARARALVPTNEVILAFDADGTLWSGDIGSDLFETLLAEEGVREEAREALLREARDFGVAVSGSPTDVARALYAAFEAGTYAEDRAFATAAWAFAGFSLSEARRFAERVILEKKLEERFHRFLDPILAWARAENVAAWVVSASPRFVVEPSVALLGIPAGRVIAMTPRMEGDRIASELAGPPIYGSHKLAALSAACPSAALLGAFGDSTYDAELLAGARVPVAVRPKSGLLGRAPEIPGFVVIGD
jgi:phosphatidylglycerophosphatase C